MLSTTTYRNIAWGRVLGFSLLALLAMFLAAFFGLASAVLPSFFALALILIPITLLVAIFNVELALVVSVASIFGIIPIFLQPSLPIAGVVIHTGEMLLLMLGGLVLIKTLYRPTAIMQTLQPLHAPLIVLGIMYVISITYSVGIKHDAYGLAETRNLVGWIALPVAIYAFRWHFKRMDFYLRAFAVLVALLLVAQTVSGVRLIYADRGAELISEEYSDVIRSSAGAANFLLGYALYYALGRAAMARNKFLWVVLVNLLGLGLIVTFTRGAWFAAFAGMLLFFFITRAHRLMMGALTLTVLFALVLGGGLLVAKPHLIGAVEERLFSVEEEGGKGTSVGYRLNENKQALRAIAHNPVLGVGIGGEYKKYSGTHGREVHEGEFTYIHNSYLGLAVKLGLLAIIVPFWIYRNLWRVWVRHRPVLYGKVEGLRLNLAAAISTMSMFMVNTLTQPEWLRLGGLVTVSLLIAMILTASRLIDLEAHAGTKVK